MEPTEPATEIDFARLAAYVDGEGHIAISCDKRHRYYVVQITIGNSNLALLEWCRDHFGGFICRLRYHPDPKHYAPVKRWMLTSWPAANALKRCLPYLICKREQAEVAIEFKETFGLRGTRISEADRKRREELMVKLRALTRTGPRIESERPVKKSPQGNLFAKEISN